MYILKRKNKKSIVYFLCKSYRDVNTGRNTSKIVERIGTEEEVKEKAGSQNIKKWLDNYAKEHSKKTDIINVAFNPEQQINFNNNKLFNAGYLVIKRVLNDLKVNKICDYIKKQEKFDEDLSRILYVLIYDKVFYPQDQNNYERVSNFILESKALDNIELKRCLKILSKYTNYIQAELLWTANKKIKYDTSIAFNECSNYVYNMTQPDNNSMSLTQMDMFYDKNGMPLAFFNNSNKKSDSEHQKIIIDAIKYLSKNTKFVTFSDGLPSRTLKEIDIPECDIHSIKDISIRSLNKELQNWILNNEPWKAINKHQNFNIKKILEQQNDINHERTFSRRLLLFYKSCKIKYKGEDKTLVAVFSESKKIQDRQIRYTKYLNIKDMIDQSISNGMDPDFEKNTAIFSKINNLLKTNVDEDNLYEFNDNQLNKDIIFDGFNLFVVGAENVNIESVVRVWTNRWKIKKMFTTIKNELSFIPKNHEKQDYISLHLLVTFLAVLVIQIIHKENNYKHNIEEIIKEMEEHDFVKASGLGWIPAFSDNKVSKFIDKMIGMENVTEIVPEKRMKDIIQKLK